VIKDERSRTSQHDHVASDSHATVDGTEPSPSITPAADVGGLSEAEQTNHVSNPPADEQADHAQQQQPPHQPDDQSKGTLADVAGAGASAGADAGVAIDPPGGTDHTELQQLALPLLLEAQLKARCTELIRAARMQAPELGPEKVHTIFIAAESYENAADDELNFSKGDEMLVHRMDEDGWWLSSRIVDSEIGYVPQTYMKSLDQFREEHAGDVSVLAKIPREATFVE
jgi:hypothetical protein